MKIVVTGSLGHISLPLTKELVQKGHKVTVVSSKPEKQAAIEALGATAAIGFMEDADFLTATFTGADAVYAMIAGGDLDVLIFFWDPMEAQPHDTDIKALLRLVEVWNLPMACDQSTADFLMSSPLMLEEYHCHVPDYSGYLKRSIPAT